MRLTRRFGGEWLQIPPALRALVALIACCSTAVPAASAGAGAAADSLRGGAIRWSPHRFVSARGDSVDAELGTLRVPERHGAQAGPAIELAMVRFRCTGPRPGDPIVYLAGGPGGSGIAAARGSRFPLFMAMRQLGDVIALDQRGVGASRPSLQCSQVLRLPLDQPATAEARARALAPLAAACAEQLRAAGVDLTAYNTNESADDLESLREALGARRLRLWTISYGTHLALATIRRHPASVERAILAGTEGPDHTEKLPRNTQRLLEQFSALAAADSVLAAQLHGETLIAVLDRVLARLKQAPARVRVPPLGGAPGDSIEVALGHEEVQETLAAILGSAEAQAWFPAFVVAADRGDWALLTLLELARGLRHEESIGNAMGYAMDCASGASRERRAEISREAASTTLGDATRNELACGAWGVRELDAAFRRPVRASTPVLFISGTQDLNTPPSNAEEVRRGFSNSAHLVIEGVAHSDPLFLSSPRILEVMLRFMRGEPVSDTSITVPFQLRHDLRELARALR